MFKVYLSKGTWIDISDYIVGSSGIPYCSRNSDFTPRYENISISVASTVSEDIIAINDIDVNDLVKVTDASDNFLWGGYVFASEFNYESQTYDIEVHSTLEKLKETRFGYDQMHALFMTGVSTQYWINYASHNTVDFTWALKCAFSVNGLTLDTNAVYSTFLFNKTAKTGWAGKSIYYSNLYFDENQLYCLNLSTAANPATTITEYVIRVDNPVSAQVTYSVIYKGNHEPELNCAEFVEECLTALRLTLKQTDMNNYLLVALTSNHTIDSDNKYEYKLTTILPQNIDAGISTSDIAKPGDVWNITNSPRNKYYLSSETKLNEYDLGGADKINIMKNFTVYFPDSDNQSVLFNESACVMELISSLTRDSGSSDAALNIAGMRYKATSVTRQEEKITCPFQQTFYTVVENFIDLENRTSKIIQEL